MSILEIIQHVGVENIRVQWLSESMIEANFNRKGASITFATHEANVRSLAGLSDTEFVGMVVWMKKDNLPDTLR